jgi:3-methyladenine DNA glycosylase AlkD
MELKEIMASLEKMGSPQTKKTFLKHGAPEPYFGVKVGDMKTIVKHVKKNHELALALYDTGNSDAMYLAGLISDPSKMSKSDLQRWAENATWYMISEFAVAWTASESPFAIEMAMKWIKSKEEKIACAGWTTYSSFVAITDDAAIDKKQISELLDSIEKNIHKAQNRVRHCMNGFIISVGGYIPTLTKRAIQVAKNIGEVSVDMGGTACKVPDAAEYIDKILARGVAGKKKKTAKC